jgi:hypothetical protein
MADEHSEPIEENHLDDASNNNNNNNNNTINETNNTNHNDDENMSLVTNQDQLPHVLSYGPSANLTGLRREESRSEFLSQCSSSSKPAILETSIPCRLK